MLIMLLNVDLFGTTLLLHPLEVVFDDGTGQDEQNEKDDTGKEQELVALDHSLSLVLVLLHDVTRKYWSQRKPKYVLEDAVESGCRILSELRDTADDYTCSYWHDSRSRKEKQPCQ